MVSIPFSLGDTSAKVHVIPLAAHLQHGVNRVVVFDIDLHHGT